MLGNCLTLLVAIMAVIWSLACGYDPDPLQDFCVAVDDSKAAVFVNGRTCKNPEIVTPNDFFFSGLNRAGNISYPVGARVTPVFVNELPGLNTLGVALARVDIVPGGLNPLHYHPRASETFVVLEGTLYVGFITSNSRDPNTRNRLFAKILHAGDVYAFPRGLIHFQYNVGKGNAVAFVGFNSQDPGIVTVANAVFGSEPPVFPDVLARTFQLDKKIINYLQSVPWRRN